MNFLSRFFDEMEVGDSFRTRGRTITESDIVQWCALTGDWHVLHTNAHYAATSRFGQRIAPGLLVQAYAAGLGIPADSTSIQANYGSDKLRFTAPTFIGDTLHLRCELLEKAVKREGRDGVIRLRWDMHNQNDTVVMASELQILVAFRPKVAV